MSLVAIHMGCHVHSVSKGICLDTLDCTYDYIDEQIIKTLNAKNFAMIMAANKKFFADYLLCFTLGQ